jgi:hypothetical protein
MRGAVLHRRGDVRIEERNDPKIVEPTDAIIRLSASSWGTVRPASLLSSPRGRWVQSGSSR